LISTRHRFSRYSFGQMSGSESRYAVIPFRNVDIAAESPTTTVGSGIGGMGMLKWIALQHKVTSVGNGGGDGGVMLVPPGSGMIGGSILGVQAIRLLPHPMTGSLRQTRRLRPEPLR
jgi:hypothetical protein